MRARTVLSAVVVVALLSLASMAGGAGAQTGDARPGPTDEKQAAEAGHATEEEILLLTTHGILHLLGFDHAEPEEEREMFELQRQLLLTFLASRGRGT